MSPFLLFLSNMLFSFAFCNIFVYCCFPLFSVYSRMQQTSCTGKPCLFHGVNTCMSCVYLFLLITKQFLHLKTIAALCLCCSVGNMLRPTLPEPEGMTPLCQSVPIQLLTGVELGGEGGVPSLVLVWISHDLICVLQNGPIASTKSLSFKLSLNIDGTDRAVKRIQSLFISVCFKPLVRILLFGMLDRVRKLLILTSTNESWAHG